MVIMDYDPTTHLPISKATTLYELWEEIIQVVRDEPKRLAMEYWKLDFNRFTDYDRIEYLHLTAPACGTVCCWAGWADTLRRTGDDGNPFACLAVNALLLLCGPAPLIGTSIEQFDHWAALQQETSNLFYLMPSVTNQSPAYVEAVVRHAERIMKTYKDYLQATPIPAYPL